MNRSETKIAIIGAGVSGLVAAQRLENEGLAPHVFDSEERAGGRLKTDLKDSYQLDRGFQVLLDSYPMVKKYLDPKKLKLQKLDPGAVVFKNGKQLVIGDPLRNPSFLLPTLFSPLASFQDKLKTFNLNKSLKNKSLEDVFESKESSTLEYLREKGFSEHFIQNFFKPFFSGIYLEPELQTSSRMFEFVYKMFGTGSACIPLAGIEEIAKDLKVNLKKTKFSFGQKVKRVENRNIMFEDGSKKDFDFIIIATDATAFISNLRDQEVEWKSCDTVYFETDQDIIARPLIGLIPDAELINNIFYHSSISNLSKGSKHLLSVTIVKDHKLSEMELVMQVEHDLAKHCGIRNLNFIKRYQIKKALPKLDNLRYELAASETQLMDGIFLAGDQLLNSSLNAAMISGERAAEGLIQRLDGAYIA